MGTVSDIVIDVDEAMIAAETGAIKIDRSWRIADEEGKRIDHRRHTVVRTRGVGR
jgi:uncharacterized protein YcbX